MNRHGTTFASPESNKKTWKMNHTCVTKYFPEQSRKVNILKNYFVLYLVSPRNLLNKSLDFLYCYKAYMYLLTALFCQIIELEKLSTTIDVEYKMQGQLLAHFRIFFVQFSLVGMVCFGSSSLIKKQMVTKMPRKQSY